MLTFVSCLWCVELRQNSELSNRLIGTFSFIRLKQSEKVSRKLSITDFVLLGSKHLPLLHSNKIKCDTQFCDVLLVLRSPGNIRVNNSIKLKFIVEDYPDDPSCCFWLCCYHIWGRCGGVPKVKTNLMSVCLLNYLAVSNFRKLAQKGGRTQGTGVTSSKFGCNWLLLLFWFFSLQDISFTELFNFRLLMMTFAQCLYLNQM